LTGKEVIVDVLKVDDGEIKEDTRFVEDLKADSMDQFSLLTVFAKSSTSTSMTRTLARSRPFLTRSLTSTATRNKPKRGGKHLFFL